ncbi:MAG: elongation factor P [Bacteroidales bacterium]|nr:elongation factor P [Bacteroidales bacterium]
MATTADFRNGLVIEFNNDLFTIVQFQHVKPGKGPAFVRTRLKNIKSGRVLDNTFTAGVKVNVARVERRPYQYLYKDEVGYYFMHLETFEQIHVEEHVIDYPEFLMENQQVEVVVHADTENILSVELPQFIVFEITYTEKGLKGDTATNALKQATLENGSVIMVPLFINNGDKIKVDTHNRSYMERVKG